MSLHQIAMMTGSQAEAAGTHPAMPHVDGVEHGWADVDGLRIHYAQAGECDPIVLLHGWPQHWWGWRHVIMPLSERYRVICPDLPGIAGSAVAKDRNFLHCMARVVIYSLDHTRVTAY